MFRKLTIKQPWVKWVNKKNYSAVQAGIRPPEPRACWRFRHSGSDAKSGGLSNTGGVPETPIPLLLESVYSCLLWYNLKPRRVSNASAQHLSLFLVGKKNLPTLQQNKLPRNDLSAFAD